MALIQCPECLKDMSDTLEACPHCGFKNVLLQQPIPYKNNNNFCTHCGKPYFKNASKCPYCKVKNENKKKTNGLFIAISIIVVCIIVVICFNNDTNYSNSNSTQNLQPSTSNTTKTNRKIRYTVGGYTAAPTEEILDKVTELSIAKDYAALQQLLDSGMIIQLKGGTKVEIVKMKFTVVKFRIFGTNTEYWTVVEALKNQP